MSPAAKAQILPLSIGGGWTTEEGPSARVALSGEAAGAIPWLVKAENAVYTRRGWPIKAPGASRVNATASGSSDAVMGIFDFWRSALGLDPTQRRVLYAGSSIYSEIGGTLTSLKSGLETAKMAAYETMNDDLVMTSASDTDVPQVWDQVGAIANLGGSPPNFHFHVQHKDYMWAAGAQTYRSRLYYSASGNHESWTGAGTGSIDIAPDDGDVITGLKSLHNNELIIFKGPNRGSVWRLSGSAPTGDGAFTLKPIVRGVGATNHQAIVIRGRDILFWDHNGIHSLAATEQYGDYAPAYVSDPIRTYFLANLNHNRLGYVSGVDFTALGWVLWAVTRSNAITNNAILVWDYRFTPPRFALWPVAAIASLAIVRDGSRGLRPWGGNYTGRMLRLCDETRLWDTAAYTYTATTPHLAFGDAFHDKIATKGHIELLPTHDANLTVGYRRDAQTQQTVSVNMATGVATLGTSTTQFMLDSSPLQPVAPLHAFWDMGGMFKDLQLELSQGGGSVHAEPHGLSLELADCGVGTAAIPG